MNDERWRVVCLHLEEGWKGEMTEQRRAVYGTFLKHLDFEEAMAALRALALEGRPWLPTVPELAKAIHDVTQAAKPSWTEAWNQIQQCMAAGRVLDTTHGLVVRFIDMEGGVWRLGQMPFFDPDKGDMRVHQLSVRFAEFCDVQQARDRQRIALGAERLAELEGRERVAALLPAGPGAPD